MHVEIQNTPGSPCLLSVSGDVDVATCGELRAAGEESINEAGCPGIRIDLRHVSFIDSSGIGALIAIRNAGDVASVPVIFANPSPKVSSVLELTRLSDVFTIERDDLS